ncbi:MAG: phenylalanine--tRNA ligase subunit beta [Bacteriovoracales bacterium]|nr:phenylalanine--tRNA ligase subunit beta [Bacteriovoracales bacterium]
MLISTRWVKDFVDIPEVEAESMAERVTLATAEVENVIRPGAHLKDILIVVIEGVRKHPSSDRLHLASFDLEGQGTLEVVCGAPNVRVGLKVPYAPVGTTFPNGLTLTPKKIRGVVSRGMLCSEAELGLGEESSGLMELADHAPLGQCLLDFLSLEEDVVLDIDNKSLTHRPDLWGHFGFAREFSAIWEVPLKDPFDEKWKGPLEKHFTSSPSPLRLNVDSQGACLSYWALAVDGVEVTESPAWMQTRLLACGMRPINSIVDISNYVMLELGMPNHIFDRDKIAGDSLTIAPLGKKENFTTLDEVERPLVETDTVICDEKNPLVIGGIMGGLGSSVEEKTKNLLIEAANWKPSLIRQTCTRLGLRTESSQRYEKSLDGNLCYRTLLRILELVLRFNPKAKVLGAPVYDGVDLNASEKVTISTCVERINAQLGLALSTSFLTTLLESLGFVVNVKGSGALSIEVPSFRANKDVECEADIVEEVGRIVGYGRIDPAAPRADMRPHALRPEKAMHRRIQDYLFLKGRCLEVMTYPLVGKTLLEKCRWPDLGEKLTLLNPLSKDHDRMRPSLVPSLLSVSSLNQKSYHRFQFFEIGRVYLPGREEFAVEHTQAALAFFDQKGGRFQEMLGEVENLLRYLNIPAVLGGEEKGRNPVIPKEWPGCHPYEYQPIKVMGQKAGAVFSIHPLMQREFKIKGHLCVAVIDLQGVEGRRWPAKINYRPLPKYPSSVFDCTVVCEPQTPVGDVIGPLQKLKLKELVQVKIVDVFVPKGQMKCVTLRATFFDPKGTLDSATVKGCERSVVAALEKGGFPLKPSG